MKTIDKIKKLQAKLHKEFKNLDQERANLTFKCSCGKYHKIKDCSVIQTHWSNDGDWCESELQIVCPKTKIKNRLLYNSLYSVDWKLRCDSDYSADRQFKNKFKHLFKEIIKEYNERSSEPWQNNYYIDENHEKFGIKIKKENDNQ